MDNKTDIDASITVKSSDKGHYAQDIIIGKHLLIGDEPVAVGGNDLGPSPYDYLLAALGTCTSITLRMFADLKGIPLTSVSVKLAHTKIYATDCAECENANSKIDHIQRNIYLSGDLSPEQRHKLLEIANKCPVHRTLSSKMIITTKLVK